MTKKTLLVGSAVALALAAGTVAYGTSATAQPYGGWGMMGPGYGYMHGPGMMMGGYGPGYGPRWMRGNRGDARDGAPGYGPPFGPGFMHRGYGPGYGPYAPRTDDPNSN